DLSKSRRIPCRGPSKWRTSPSHTAGMAKLTDSFTAGCDRTVAFQPPHECSIVLPVNKLEFENVICKTLCGSISLASRHCCAREQNNPSAHQYWCSWDVFGGRENRAADYAGVGQRVFCANVFRRFSVVVAPLKKISGSRALCYNDDWFWSP